MDKEVVMKIKRIIYTTLLLIWMLIIFLFSNQNADNSQSTSDRVANFIIDVVEVITNKEISDDDRNSFVEDSRFIIRKTAHFTIYFVLGILICLTLTSYQINNRIVFSIIFCLLYVCSDEIHQMFSDGRTFKLLDILIDSVGASIGILITSKFNKYKYE